MTEQDRQILAAAARGDAAALTTALEAGGDPKARDRFGAPALALAAARGELDCVARLLDAGAEVDRTSDAGNSALMLAAARGHVEVMRRLLAAGADPERRNKWGLGAADWGRWPKNAAEVEALLLESRPD